MDPDGTGARMDARISGRPFGTESESGCGRGVPDRQQRVIPPGDYQRRRHAMAMRGIRTAGVFWTEGTRHQLGHRHRRVHTGSETGQGIQRSGSGRAIHPGKQGTAFLPGCEGLRGGNDGTAILRMEQQTG